MGEGCWFWAPTVRGQAARVSVSGVCGRDCHLPQCTKCPGSWEHPEAALGGPTVGTVAVRLVWRPVGGIAWLEFVT